MTCDAKTEKGLWAKGLQDLSAATHRNGAFIWRA